MNDTKLSMARLALEQLSRKERLNLLRDLGLVGGETTAQPTAPRLLRRDEVARRLSVSKRTVDVWAQQGLITKRTLPGRVRACGFSSVEIEKLILHGTISGR